MGQRTFSHIGQFFEFDPQSLNFLIGILSHLDGLFDHMVELGSRNDHLGHIDPVNFENGIETIRGGCHCQLITGRIRNLFTTVLAKLISQNRSGRSTNPIALECVCIS